MKPREYWVHPLSQYWGDEECSVTDDLSKWSKRVHPEVVHVREVIPGTITISREEFRAACLAETGMLSDMEIELLERRLFESATLTD